MKVALYFVHDSAAVSNVRIQSIRVECGNRLDIIRFDKIAFFPLGAIELSEMAFVCTEADIVYATRLLFVSSHTLAYYDI